MSNSSASKTEKIKNTIKHFEGKEIREKKHAETDYKNKDKHLVNAKMARDRINNCEDSLRKIEENEK